MASVNPASWTGRPDKPRKSAFDFLDAALGTSVVKQSPPPTVAITVDEVAVMERPVAAEPVKAEAPKVKVPRPSPVPDNFLTSEGLDEYADIAALVGVNPPALAVERFKTYLRASGLTVYSLAETVAYMDDKAKTEGKFEWGWEWRPLRSKDAIETAFGRPAGRASDSWQRGLQSWGNSFDGREAEMIRQARMLQNMGSVTNTPASDYYQSGAGRGVYNLTVPLHALKKVVKIEKEYPGDKAFFVSDYALAPAIQHPDPFLMVVIPNAGLNRGEGRFVIDFWDEPNFGIERMLKSDV